MPKGKDVPVYNYEPGGKYGKPSAARKGDELYKVNTSDPSKPIKLDAPPKKGDGVHCGVKVRGTNHQTKVFYH